MRVTFKIVFLRNEEGLWLVVGKKVVKSPTKILRWKSKAFTIDWGSPAFTQKLQRVYLVDIVAGKQVLTKDGAQALMSPEQLDVVVNTNVIKDLMGSLSGKLSDKIIPLIIGAIIGFLAGFLTGYLIMEQQLEAAYQNMLENTVFVQQPDPKAPLLAIGHLLGRVGRVLLG